MKNPKILIVEDEAIIAYDLKMKLERQGFAVLPIVVTAKAAVKAAKKTNPDLILMDILLKGSQTGIDAAFQIQALKSIPIVFLTGNRWLIKESQLKKLHNCKILNKPASEFDILAAIKDLLITNQSEPN
jgi:CheY-like chemotaxis protein